MWNTSKILFFMGLDSPHPNPSSPLMLAMENNSSGLYVKCTNCTVEGPTSVTLSPPYELNVMSPRS